MIYIFFLIDLNWKLHECPLFSWFVLCVLYRLFGVRSFPIRKFNVCWKEWEKKLNHAKWQVFKCVFQFIYFFGFACHWNAHISHSYIHVNHFDYLFICFFLFVRSLAGILNNGVHFKNDSIKCDDSDDPIRSIQCII